MKFVVGETGETPRKTYPNSVLSTIKPTWSDKHELRTPAVGGKNLTVSATELVNNVKKLHNLYF